MWAATDRRNDGQKEWPICIKICCSGWINWFYWIRRCSDHCIQILTAAIEQNPNNANLYNSRGWYHFQQGAYTESIADYTRVEELGVETIDYFYQPTVYYVRGLAYAQIGEPEAAITDLETALKMYEASDNDAAVREIQTTLEKIKNLPEQEQAS